MLHSRKSQAFESGSHYLPGVPKTNYLTFSNIDFLTGNYSTIIEKYCVPEDCVKSVDTLILLIPLFFKHHKMLATVIIPNPGNR